MDTQSPVVPDAERTALAPFEAKALSATLTVKDIEKSLAWYNEVVGFTVENRHEREGVLRAVTLSAGAVRILIGQDDGAKGWERVKGEGFSLMLTTGQNVDDIAARIKEAGWPLDAEPRDTPWGFRVFRVLDPDGFKLAISSERSEQTEG